MAQFASGTLSEFVSEFAPAAMRDRRVSVTQVATDAFGNVLNSSSQGKSAGSHQTGVLTRGSDFIAEDIYGESISRDLGEFAIYTFPAPGAKPMLGPSVRIQPLAVMPCFSMSSSVRSNQVKG